MLDIVLCFKTSSPSTMVATIVACATISMSSCRKSQSNTVMLAIFQLMFLVISFLVSKVIKFCKICKAKHTFLAIFDDFETKIAYFASRRLKICKKKLNNNHPSFIYADMYQSLDKFVHRSAEEMRSMRHQMANTDTDDTEVF